MFNVNMLIDRSIFFTHEKRWLIFVMLFSGCSKFYYFPDRIYHYPPEKNGFQAQEVHFTAQDNTKLFAWFFPAQGESIKGTIVQFHGNAENISSHYLSLVWLTRHGYNLFTFDYRGYGRSEGDPNPKGVVMDGVAALEEAWKWHEKTHAKKFIIVGQSIGGAIGLRSFVDFSHKDNTDILVMDSTFISYKEVVRQKLASSFLTWIFQPLAYIFTSDQYAPKQYMKQLKNPLLVIYDKKDPVVDFENGKELYDIYTGPKTFWELEQGAHLGVFTINAEKNQKRFLEYLEKTNRI